MTTSLKTKPGRGEVDFLAALKKLGANKPEIVALFDQIENLQFWIKDAAGRFVWVNTPFLVDFGFKDRSQVVGLTDYDITDATLANQYRSDDEQVLSGRSIRSRVELVGRFNHTVQWYITSKVPLHNRAGKVVGTAGVTMPYRHKEAAASNRSLGPAIEYIIKHFGEQVTNRDLAKACKISLRVFHQQFVATYHTTPHEDIRRYRVRASCSPLVFSSKSMAEIAHEFGFSDQSHYTREFRRLMNEPPTAYRTRFQQVPQANDENGEPQLRP